MDIIAQSLSKKVDDLLVCVQINEEKTPLPIRFTPDNSTANNNVNELPLADDFERFFRCLVTQGQDIVTKDVTAKSLTVDSKNDKEFIAMVYSQHLGEVISEEDLNWWSDTQFPGYYSRNHASLEIDIFNHPKAFLNRMFKQLNVAAEMQQNIRQELGRDENLQSFEYEAIARKLYTDNKFKDQKPKPRM